MPTSGRQAKTRAIVESSPSVVRPYRISSSVPKHGASACKPGYGCSANHRKLQPSNSPPSKDKTSRRERAWTLDVGAKAMNAPNAISPKRGIEKKYTPACCPASRTQYSPRAKHSTPITMHPTINARVR
ncbi:hypothetical protein D3C80_1732160 [compost metagenome]